MTPGESVKVADSRASSRYSGASRQCNLAVRRLNSCNNVIGRPLTLRESVLHAQPYHIVSPSVERRPNKAAIPEIIPDDNFHSALSQSLKGLSVSTRCVRRWGTRGSLLIRRKSKFLPHNVPVLSIDIPISREHSLLSSSANFVPAAPSTPSLMPRTPKSVNGVEVDLLSPFLPRNPNSTRNPTSSFTSAAPAHVTPKPQPVSFLHV